MVYRFPFYLENSLLASFPWPRWIVITLLTGGIWLARAGTQGHAAESPVAEDLQATNSHLPHLERRFHRQDFVQGLQQGREAFLREVGKGSFVALTGVEPRRPIRLLEGATYTIAADNSITFVLADGTLVPPLSPAGYEAIKTTLPFAQQAVLDDKFFWHLQRNPAIALIAADLGRGKYRELLRNNVFDTDTYYLKPFLGHLFWAAAQADVALAELLPLVEVHFLTLEYPYFREANLAVPAGTVHSFYKYEQELTNKQYLMRSLLQTPLEPWARLEAIKQVEATHTKKEYTDAESTSTTVALGRLPLPTPLAAEDTPAVHGLNIAHLTRQGIDLFPEEVQQAALQYEALYKNQLKEEGQLRTRLLTLAAEHHSEILKAINGYQRESFWLRIGFTRELSGRSVAQMDTSRLLGIYATRIEGIKRVSAQESYPAARAHYIDFFQTNSPGLADGDLLAVFFCDQAFNPQLWRTLKRQVPRLVDEINAIQRQIYVLESSYAVAARQEAFVFRQLQQHNLDISTEAFSLLSVGMAKRMSDLVAQKLQPGDRQHPAYLNFTRALYPFMRDMPDLNMQWGNGHNIKRYGLDNYLVPDLMVFHPNDAPTLAAMGDLWFQMVSNNDLDRWDIETFLQLTNTAYNLSANHPPASLPPAQVALLPLVDKYRASLKRVAGADGRSAPTVLHGLSRQDFRLGSWPVGKTPEPPRINRIDPSVIHQMFPFVPRENIQHLIWNLSNNSGEISLALPLILLHKPVFELKANGVVDMRFELDGKSVVLPSLNRHFESIYSPAYMARIVLPREMDQSDVEALNEVVRKTHALYGGYTPANMYLPYPLQALQSE